MLLYILPLHSVPGTFRHIQNMYSLYRRNFLRSERLREHRVYRKSHRLSLHAFKIRLEKHRASRFVEQLRLSYKETAIITIGTELISMRADLNPFHTISNFTINLRLLEPILFHPYGGVRVQSGLLLFETQ